MAEQLVFRVTTATKLDDLSQQIAAKLIANGLRPAHAHRLVANELTLTPTTRIRKLTELLEGSAGDGGKWIEASEERKVAGAKVFAFLRWDGTSRLQPEPLTENERELVVEHGVDVAVREGFFERAADYAESQEQLAAILKLFVPTVDGGDRSPDKTRRLIAAAAELLGAGADLSDTE